MTSRVCWISATCGRSPSLEGHQDLRQTPWTPLTHPALLPGPRRFRRAARRASPRCAQADVLLHFPYHSFATSVERFVKQAVDDPNVLAIKMTVYRTSDDSALVPSLIQAAERGKQAVCLVELKARFDERLNIHWSRALEEVGAHVVHGIPGLKTHAKAILVVRREREGVRHYVMIGTGNFHAKNARLYEDFGLFTTDPELGQEVANLFNTLTGYGHPRRQRKVLVAPDWMREPLIEEIERTIAAHRGGRADPDRDEDELPRRPALHRGALPSLAGGRSDRAERARDLLPEARNPGRLGDDQGGLGRGPLPRALAHLLVPPRRRAPLLHRLGRSDAAQPRLARRAAGPDRESGAARRARRHARALPRRRHIRLDARRRRSLAAAPRADAERCTPS